MPLSNDEKSSSITAAINDANAVVSGLQGFCFPVATCIKFNCHLLNEKYTKELLVSVPTGHRQEDEGVDFIYTFMMVSDAEDARLNLANLFKEARALQSDPDYDGKKDYCKDNERLSQYLYVGRSKKLRSRLSQHLGAKHEGLYAMHLQRWATQLECEIEISYFRLEGLSNLIVQAIEDGIWQSVHPILGRQGEQ